MALLCLWTGFILYGSLAPGEDLPPMGWLAWIPQFDKVVHFGFYFGQVLLLTLWLHPRRENRIWVALLAIIFSGAIELVQGEYFERESDLKDLLANSFGALSAVPVARWIDRWVTRKYLGTEKETENGVNFPSKTNK